MSPILIYLWLYTLCFLWIAGTISSFAVNDERMRERGFGPAEHYIGVFVWATICSAFLVLGVWVVWAGSDGAKHGWSLRWRK